MVSSSSDRRDRESFRRDRGVGPRGTFRALWHVRMSNLEARVTSLEERMDHHAAMMADLRVVVLEVRDELRDFRQHVERRFEQVDRRFEQIDRRFEQVHQTFLWVIGFQLTTMLAIISVLMTALFLK